MSSAIWQRYLAEFLGTFGLLLLGGGAAVATLGALVFEPYARVGVVSLTFGLVLIGLIYAFGDLSGAHFNPAVTISMLLSGRIARGDVVPYLVSQLLGGIAGIGVVAGIASGSSDLYPLAQAAALGSQCYAGSGAPPGCTFSLGAVFVTELALAFVFVLTIQLVTRAESWAKNLAPLAIGFTLIATNLFAIPIDGASLNPVRSFAPALLSVVWTSDRWAIAESWIFWVAPILGGVLASLVERALRPVPASPAG